MVERSEMFSEVQRHQVYIFYREEIFNSIFSQIIDLLDRLITNLFMPCDIGRLTFSSCNLQRFMQADLDKETYGKSLACRIITQLSPAFSDVAVAWFSNRTIWVS